MPDLSTDFYADLAAWLTVGDTAALAPHVRSSDLVAMNVYRNGVVKTCIDALASHYPVLSAVLGAENFSALARNYVAGHPPLTPSLVSYGDSLPDWLRQLDAARDAPYLADLAQLDQAWLEVWSAREAHALSGDGFIAMTQRGIDATHLRTGLIPAARVIDLNHKLLPLWVHVREGSDPPPAVELTATRQTILVWRQSNRINVRDMPTAEAAFLQTLDGGGTLGEAGAAAVTTDPAVDVTGLFAEVLREGLIPAPEEPPRVDIP